jgi:trk system potassium uptake protein TrkH
VRLTILILLLTLGFDLIGAVLLFLAWVGELGIGKAAWWGIFHSVAAFANSGFDLAGTTASPYPSLTGYSTNWLLNLTLAFLIIVGGIGFTIIIELIDFPRRRKFSIQTRLVLFGSAVLLIFGTLFIWVAERDNSQTLGMLSWPEQLLAAFFQSVSPRTAGFNTINLGALYTPTLLLIMGLMFIGGGTGSTAGGLKVSTFMVILGSLRSIILGKERTVILSRTIPTKIVGQALALGAFYSFSIILFTMLISIFDNLPLRQILFEVISAFCTVGLSLGATSQLSIVSQILLILAMFIGRIGPVLFLLAISGSGPRVSQVSYPEEAVAIG